ncbi:uncharacterized protein LOC132717188 [Ruditapes philippinarum]|uniref:uncharacterized protein LOC132717188 n=1 Tax=Ruditapes philippinarum TaxID=129788 RepID=UPI00295B43DF|nr:uncharacterized protein LOC132717188 [Ruditapes philippinarum]
MAEKTALDMVFLYVFTERYHLITVDLVYLASGEWQHVWKYVKPLKHETYVDESKITKFLEATADSLQSKSWYYTKRVGIEAEAQYNKLRKLVSIAIIKPFLFKNNQDTKPETKIPKLNFHQSQQLGVKLLEPQKFKDAGHSTSRKPNDVRGTSKYSSRTSMDNMSAYTDRNTILNEKMTRLREFCSPKEIVEELASVFKTDWRAAFEHCRISNDKGDTISFLRRILQVSYEQVCWPIAESQLVLMQREALKIVSGSNKVNAEFPDSEILQEFRRQYASISLKYLKQNFFEKHMKTLLKRHNIIYKNVPIDEENVDVYTAKCIEISWFMCVQNPPMVFQFEVNNEEELRYLFRNFQEHGHQHEYIVWPAVRLFKHGKVLEKGYAMFY